MNSKVAYVDCFAGASGDMLLGALLDAGFPEDALRKTLASLQLDGYELSVRKTSTGIIQATSVTIAVTAVQPDRSWRMIRTTISQSQLPEPVKEKSLRVFAGLARAEARVHGCPEDEVHFHELGGVDALIDVIGTVAGFAYLGIERLISSPLPMSRGWVDCQHGMLPLPAPAVCELVRQMPVYGVDINQELVTPTGAALLKTLCDEFGEYPKMMVTGVGYGAGSRTLPGNRPNFLRLVLGEARIMTEAQEVEVIETNLDDWSPEGYPYLCEQLFAAGALDVTLTPIQMKKGRPGFCLQVIAEPAQGLPLRQCILSETTAIGLRYRIEKRLTLPRQLGVIDTKWGSVAVKKVETPHGPVLYPEYEACRCLAQKAGVPLKDIYAAVAGAAPASFKADTPVEE